MPNPRYLTEITQDIENTLRRIRHALRRRNTINAQLITHGCDDNIYRRLDINDEILARYADDLSKLAYEMQRFLHGE